LVDSTGKTIHTFPGIEALPFVRGAIAPGAQRVALVTGGQGDADQSNSATLFEMTPGGNWLPQATLKLPSGAMRIVFSHDARRLAVGLDDGSVYVYNRRSRGGVWPPKPDAILERDKDGIAADAVAFSPDGDRIVAGDAAGTIRFWTLSSIDATDAVRGQTAPLRFSGTEVSVSPGSIGGRRSDFQPVESVEAATFTPSGRLVATAGADGLIRLWNSGNGLQVLRFPAAGGIIKSLEFSPDGGLL
jgi:WD40 repeat protein